MCTKRDDWYTDLLNYINFLIFWNICWLWTNVDISQCLIFLIFLPLPSSLPPFLVCAVPSCMTVDMSIYTGCHTSSNVDQYWPRIKNLNLSIKQWQNMMMKIHLKNWNIQIVIWSELISDLAQIWTWQHSFLDSGYHDRDLILTCLHQSLCVYVESSYFWPLW